MKTFFLLVLGAALCLPATHAAEPAPWPEWRAPMLTQFAEELKTLDASLASAPDSMQALSRRGDRHLFLGNFPQAVADYERMIVLDPKEDAPHWRLGIAYYFTGQFAKSARQFEKYHAYDGRDRENGIWKFLAQEKVDGLEKARAEMLSYTIFDREPFPSLYEMFAGKKSPDEVLAEISRKGLEGETQVVFFGNYYAGLDEAILGRRQRGLELLEKAVSLPQARAGGGPGYMWQVARLHWEKLRAELAAK
jgi:lipoprotein NlpI